MTPEIQERIARIRRGEIPDGYRKNILGIVPVSWNSQRVDELCTITSGSTPKRNNPDYFTGDILWVTSGELKSKYIFDTKEKITDSASKDSGLALYAPGTVVIAIYGLEAAGVRGTASIIARKSTISQACMAFTRFQNVDNEFFYYWYLNHGETIGLRYAQGTKQQNLSVDIVGAFPVCFPEFHEQQKIAAILSAQDSVIELQERLVTEKRRQKKYLMQQLLTGKQRLPGFSGAWVTVSVGYCIREYKNLSNDVVSIPVYSSSRKGLIPQSEYYDQKEAVETNLGYKVVPQGYATYRHMSDDDIFHFNVNNTGGEILVSSEYPVFTSSENCDLGFLIPSLNETPRFRYFCRTQKLGGTRTRLYFHNLVKYRLSLPPIAEQKAIADILSTADREIDLLQQKLEQEKRKKKALSQLLLTGIVRV